MLDFLLALDIPGFVIILSALSLGLDIADGLFADSGLILSLIGLLWNVFIDDNDAFCWDFNFKGTTSLVFSDDELSSSFLLLTSVIIPICYLADTAADEKYGAALSAVQLFLNIAFSTCDLFYFYVSFESILIPIFIIIGIGGSRERKIKAAYYFFLYTLFGSLIILFGLFYLYLLVGSTNYDIISSTALEADQERLVWFCFFVAFAVKIPLFPFHIWLPEAHVEAPTIGSILLAALLLKLGGYGFIQFSAGILEEGSAYFAPLVTTLSLLGVVYGSLATIRQIDLKRIIAYSSVAHINLVILGIFSDSVQGVAGAIYLIWGHGVVSAALFFCIGVLYDRHHSRLLRYYGGLVTVIPLFAGMFMAFSIANMGFPGTSNFIGEVLLFVGVFASNSFVLIFATAGIVLSAAYSVWLLNRVIFGTLKTTYINCFADVTRLEFTILATLLVWMLYLGIAGDSLLVELEDDLDNYASDIALVPFLTTLSVRPTSALRASL